MDPALQSMINNMPEKTGKSLEDWFKVLEGHTFSKHSEAVNILKKEYEVTHGFANTIVHLFKQSSTPDQTENDLVVQQFKGKESLLPLFESIIELVKGFGEDVQIIPKKTTVSFVRSKQFALIKAATKQRIDLGLKLRSHENTERLEGSGPFGSMCTHRVRLQHINDIDAELSGWLREAYEEA